MQRLIFLLKKCEELSSSLILAKNNEAHDLWVLEQILDLWFHSANNALSK